jgi:hypothetical protein
VNATDDFSAAWTRAPRAKPAGWRRDSLQCASPGLDLRQRSERWLANAHGPDGAVEQVEEADPVAALNSLVEQVRRR